MNFQGLGKIEDYKFHIDTAFRRAKKAADEVRLGVIGKKMTKQEKSKTVELARIEAIKGSIESSLSIILKAYPSLDGLAEFYRELVRNFLDYKLLKQSLGALGWAIQKTDEFTRMYRQKIKACMDMDKINQYRREYYGRISSVLRQIKNQLELLEESRKIMLDFPSIKQDMPTIAIAGFPNVGKTTLLSKLTDSKPDIQPYAFTTTKINVGYYKKDYDRVQFLDTPGTLDRFNKMNAIEKQAHLAIKYCADKILYVFDLSEPFPIEDQLKLYGRTKEEYNKEILIYFSKQDVLDKELIENFIKKHRLKDVITSLDDFKQSLMKKESRVQHNYKRI